MRNINFSVQNEQSCQKIPNCSNIKLIMTNLPKFQRKLVYLISPRSFKLFSEHSLHLKQQDFDVQQMRIDITSNKDSLYRSFRIIAPGEYKDILMCPKVWPVGVKVREYKSRSYGRNHNNAGQNTYGGGRFKQ